MYSITLIIIITTTTLDLLIFKRAKASHDRVAISVLHLVAVLITLGIGDLHGQHDRAALRAFAWEPVVLLGLAYADPQRVAVAAQCSPQLEDGRVAAAVLMTGVKVAVWTFAEERCPVPVPRVDVLVQQVDQVLRQLIISALEILGGALALLLHG